MTSVTSKQPTPEQMQEMQEYAEICAKAMEFLSKYEMNVASQQASIKIQESMFWAHSFLLNGGAIRVEVIPANVQQDAAISVN